MVTLQMDARIAPPTGALLVRLAVSGPAGMMALARVPAPHTVTVTFGDAAIRARVDDDALAALGYRVVGTHQAIDVAEPMESEVLLLVRAALLDAQPAWTTRLLQQADRVFDCDMGPVQRVLAGVLDRHLAG